MKIGYACICLGVPNTNMRTCTLKYMNEDKLKEIIQHNLEALSHILDYNIKEGIRMFRISSDLIPFGSSPMNTIPWKELYRSQFQALGKKVKDNKLRVSLHPGQYTILNSTREDVVERAIEDLRYHVAILDLMELDRTHKIVLHIGGIYGDKTSAIERFKLVYNTLDSAIRRRLVIENDDRYYTIEDVLAISSELDIPVIFDNLHNEILPASTQKNEMEWIDIVKETWKEHDGVQKMHYCHQDPLKQKGAHSKTIYSPQFLDFCNRLQREDLDIMLEVKDKNLSAIKCRNLLSTFDKQRLHKEWTFYEYAIRIHSLKFYQVIKAEIETSTLTFEAFYEYLEASFLEEEEKQQRAFVFLKLKNMLEPQLSIKEINTYEGIWKQFIERDKYTRLKNHTQKLLATYGYEDIANSYFFLLM